MLLEVLFAQMGIILIKLANLAVIQIGYFRAVYNIVAVGSFIAITLNVIILPYVSELESKKDKATLSYFSSLIIKFLILFGVPASIGIYLVAEPTLSILLPQYLSAANLMRILSLMLLFFPIYMVARTMLIGVGKPMLVVRADLVSLASVLIIGVILSMNTGTEGIAYAYVLAILLATIYSLIMLAKALGLYLDPGFLLKVAFSTIVMGLTTFYIIQQMSTPTMQIITGVPAGAGIYLALTLVLRTMSSEDFRVMRRTLGIARSKAPSGRLRE
jgi:O-antigen/teichoic acid export membrane protein